MNLSNSDLNGYEERAKYNSTIAVGRDGLKELVRLARLGLCEDKEEKYRILQCKLDEAKNTLEHLKHNNHHTIAEEEWRIDKALKEIEGMING